MDVEAMVEAMVEVMVGAMVEVMVEVDLGVDCGADLEVQSFSQVMATIIPNGHLGLHADGYTEETDGGALSVESDGQQQVVGDGANPTEEFFVLVKGWEDVLEIAPVVLPGTGARIVFAIVLDIIDQILNKL